MSSDNQSDKQSNSKTTNPAAPDPNQPAFGWNNYAEKINGRFAMIGFLLLLGLEWFTHQDFFTWMGFR